MKKNTKELINYIIVGILTTLINYLAYYFLLQIGCHWISANSLAWVVAVLFAFYTNKKYVFQSTKDIKTEISQFFAMRFATLVIENICLFILIQTLGCHQMISKVTVSIMTVVLNYILCKFKIFRKEGVYHG